MGVLILVLWWSESEHFGLRLEYELAHGSSHSEVKAKYDGALKKVEAALIFSIPLIDNQLDCLAVHGARGRQRQSHHQGPQISPIPQIFGYKFYT